MEREPIHSAIFIVNSRSSRFESDRADALESVLEDFCSVSRVNLCENPGKNALDITRAFEFAQRVSKPTGVIFYSGDGTVKQGLEILSQNTNLRETAVFVSIKAGEYNINQGVYGIQPDPEVLSHTLRQGQVLFVDKLDADMKGNETKDQALISFGFIYGNLVYAYEQARGVNNFPLPKFIRRMTKLALGGRGFGPYRPDRVTIEGENGLIYEGLAAMVETLNGPHLARIKIKRGTIYDGRLTIAYIPVPTGGKVEAILRLGAGFALANFGLDRANPFLRQVPGTHVSIQFSSPQTYHADGEAGKGRVQGAHVQVIPATVPFLVRAD